MVAGSPAIDDEILGRHLVCYLDLLGFRSVILAVDQQAAGAILILLQELADSRGEFSASISGPEGGEQTSTAQPAVSTFSDHIVLSYDLDKLLTTKFDVYTALSIIRDTAARLAHRARAVGCLVRGGVAIGPLYHRGGVVFGPAMVAAHRLESVVAIHPRIVIQPEAMEFVEGDTPGNGIIFQDVDGCWCLDYMRGDLNDVDAAFGFRRDNEACNSRSSWARHVRDQAWAHGQELAASGNPDGAEKWLWFARRFEQAMGEADKQIFNADGAPLEFGWKLPVGE